MRFSRIPALLTVAGVLAIGTASFLAGSGVREQDDPFARELAKLETRRDHAAPGSSDRFKAGHKIERIARRLAGLPAFEAPEEFARLMNEMRIPADRKEPEYEAGYLVRELATARAAKRSPAAALAWENRGPGNVAGRARAIVVDPDDPPP
ncbi:MAG: hypothetical protein IPI34_04860 [bacterium]|nr:hypothetical protein [bacterium]